jgi:hypothetical protein
MECEDGLLLVVGEPVVSRDGPVVLVRLAVPLSPREELAAGDAEPRDEALGDEVGLVGPDANEVDDGVPDVVGNPALGQGSPSSFFSWVYSCAISAMTLSFLASWAFRRAFSASRAFSRGLGPGAGFSSAVPLVDHARLEAQLVAQVRDGDLVHHVATKDLRLLLGGVVTTDTLARHQGLLPT